MIMTDAPQDNLVQLRRSAAERFNCLPVLITVHLLSLLCSFLPYFIYLSILCKTGTPIIQASWVISLKKCEVLLEDMGSRLQTKDFINLNHRLYFSSVQTKLVQITFQLISVNFELATHLTGC